MSKQLLLVGFGGFIGSVGRYLLSGLITKGFPNSFPIGTFTVNVLGCLIIGVIYGISERFGWLTQEWRLFLATGICGGFTTFSALPTRDSSSSKLLNI
jgi:CrcB protein